MTFKHVNMWHDVKMGYDTRAHTFSEAAETVKTKVENTGLGVAAFIGHLSNVAPIGRQNKGTESGIGLLGMSSSGKRARIPLHKFYILIKKKVIYIYGYRSTWTISHVVWRLIHGLFVTEIYVRAQLLHIQIKKREIKWVFLFENKPEFKKRENSPCPYLDSSLSYNKRGVLALLCL